MDPRYSKWVEDYVSCQPEGVVRGKCKDAARAMAKAFPELREAAGFVYCTWGRDQHWWCVTPEGTIVDPTVSQFISVFHYEELDLNDPKTRDLVPTGRCLDCGEDVYNGNTFCGSSCEQSTRAYLGI